MSYKYVCSVKNFPNCRVHDGGFDSGLRFFKNIEQVKEELLRTYSDLEFGDLYAVETGEKVARISYQFQRHEFRRLEINRTSEYLEPENNFESYILSDNGYGKKEWQLWGKKINAGV